MCGIAGAMSRNGAAVDIELLERLGVAQAHRGPDGRGHYRQDAVGLAHQRLAIIDLTTGDQPLFGPDGLVLIANGEIYNNPELREALAGAPFVSKSDCEPPLYLYQRHGLDYVDHLRGMYAIALYDPAAKQLVLSRDPFGIKPLYYAETPTHFLFASEPQAILATGLIERRERTEGRDELVNLQFTTGRETIFAGIHRVLPGETLVVRNGTVAERRRRAALPQGAPRPGGEDDLLKELDRRLEDSVTLHQRSDVPYGMFLSGGIDSAAVLALMARLNCRKPVLAFTAYFPGTSARDETDLAGALAREVGAEHVEVPVTEEDFWGLLPSIAAMMDDPAADYAILPTAKLAMTARQSVKVVLSGEGGDELFAGYGRYRSACRPWPFARSMRRKGILAELGLLRETSDWRAGMRRAEQEAADQGWNRLQQAQAVDCADWLPNDLLTKLDRTLMAQGIEGRVPFLDRQIADLAFRLPDPMKLAEGRGKYLLRKWLSDVLPSASPFSPKRGFTVPVADWLARRPDLGPLLAAQPQIQALCRPGTVEALFQHLDKRNGFAAWTLLFYALWHHGHIQNRPIEGGVFDVLSQRE
jgi:asparagine synthase (glutamine-hydrolysing)